jgi:hypothetical protein
MVNPALIPKVENIRRPPTNMSDLDGIRNVSETSAG